MEDVKEDVKDDKSINFHQMELDDRILKVNSMNFITNSNLDSSMCTLF